MQILSFTQTPIQEHYAKWISGMFLDILLQKYNLFYNIFIVLKHYTVFSRLYFCQVHFTFSKLLVNLHKQKI